MTDLRIFPENFLWGAATAAYQIEGSPLADGAGPSIWQRFAHTPGMTENGDTGDVACDHYRRYADDVAMMKGMGMQAYRFSTAWARIFPEGTGQVNAAGLDHYDRLVDALCEAGIAPLVTLYHWDMPAALDDRGGWLNPDSANWFADYAMAMARRLDDRVYSWTTLNEPWVVTDGGYLHGALAPGHRSPYECVIASHNLMRAHGAAVQALRTVTAKPVGLVVNIEPKYPASDNAADVAATARAEAYMNRQYLDPIFHKRYPAQMAEIFGDAWQTWPTEDFDLIAQPIDFLGINYYTRNVVRDAPDVWPQRVAPVTQDHATYTTTGWEVYAQGLTDTLLWVKANYGAIPLYVTENGSAFYDPPKLPENGIVSDPLRVDYLSKHLKAVHAAIDQGVDVRGYMAWSLMDNLEWSLGYSRRFGIVHVDFETQVRTLKDSARFYAQVIAANAV